MVFNTDVDEGEEGSSTILAGVDWDEKSEVGGRKTGGLGVAGGEKAREAAWRFWVRVEECLPRRIRERMERKRRRVR